jgi:outer membrane protein assembly factor BamA
VTFRGEDVDITSIDNKPLRAPEILAGRGHHTITGAQIGFRRDTTDSILLPTRGSVMDVSYEHAGALGGQYNFDKFEGSATGYWTLYDDLLDRKTVLRTSARVGYITPDAPFFERFYAGGVGSMRGFRYRGISPRSGPDDDPVGGNFSVMGTVEVGFPLAGESLRGVVFTDIGDVESKARFGTVRVSTGVGVRLTLPIFGQVPLGLDFGFPILKDRQDDTQIVSFTLGFSQ